MRNIFYIGIFCTIVGLLYNERGFTQTSINLPTSGAAGANPAGNNVLIYDNGGPTANYNSSVSGYVYLTAQAGQTITISGSYDTEGGYDYFKIFSGNGTGGTLLSNLSGISSWFSYTGGVGIGLTIQLTSDGSVQYTGLNLLVTYSSTTTLNIPTTGSNSVTCGTNTILFDNGGRGSAYSASIDGYTVLNCSGTGQINIRGTFYTESGYDFIRIYAGVGTGGTLLATYSGAGTTNTAGYTVNYTGAVGQALTVRFNSDGSVQYNGFELAAIYVTNCCVASTAPTSASASVNPTCPSGATTLSVSGGSLGTGASWQWYSTNCGTGSVGTGATLGVSPATTTQYWVRAEGTCGTTTCATVTVTVNTNSTAAASVSATPNPICNGSSTTISLSGGSLGTGGVWTWYSGTPGSCSTGGSVGTGTSIVKSPVVNTTYYVRAEGTCNNTACVSTAVTVDNPLATPNAGEDQYLCGATTATMAASGSGTWTKLSGSGTITTPGSATTTITGLSSGTSVFRWALTNACGSAYDDIVIIKQ